MTAAEARQLGGIARQIRGLLTGIEKLPEAFDEVEALDLRVDVAKRELRSYEELAAKYANLDREYSQKRAELEASLEILRAEMAAAQRLKEEIEEKLTALKAKFTA